MNKKGFSLVQFLMFAGALGAGAVVIMNLSEQQNQSRSTFETKFEVLELKRTISSLLYDKSACALTFTGASVGSVIPSVKNSSNQAIYEAGKKYAHDLVEITGMRTVDKNQSLGNGARVVDLVVSIRKLRSKAAVKDASFAVPLKVYASSQTGPITNCQAEEDQFVFKNGDVMTGELTTVGLTSRGHVVAGNNVSGSDICTAGTCRRMENLALSNQTCPPGQYSRGINADGTQACQAFTYSCSAGFFIQSINADGTATCVKE
ncbi:hypothetical protein [Peredibacter starrii]|uniref:Uncharacterized protein n=1 Tax=Peredibacter starrii TaxID=28202 RepID=A0AAX4HKD4_9BACT|nr:hypothetical protein [Peredibacter starrii]WPU63712.1 hypothetical protein SOO65_13540 [Peredibacter starrii]